MKVRSWGRVAAMMAAGTIGATALHAQSTDPMAPLPAKPTPVAKPAASAKPASTTAAPTAPTKVVPADTLAPGAPAPAAVATPPPPPPPPLVWQPQDVAALMAYVRGVGAEGRCSARPITRSRNCITTPSTTARAKTDRVRNSTR